MQTLIPLLADLLALLLAFLLLPRLAVQFQQMGFTNSVILGFFFLLFTLAVHALKKLQPFGQPGRNRLLDKRPLAVLGVLFSLVLTIAVAYVAGFLDSVIAVNRGLLDEPAVAIYLLLTPASWFGLSLLYMLVLSSDTEPTIAPASPRYALFSLLGLAGVSLMAVAFTAVAQAIWARFDPGSGWLLLVGLTFLLYLLLFVPPRLVYLARRHPGRLQGLALLPFLLLLAYLALVSVTGLQS